MGLLRYIETHLPPHWEQAARENRCKVELCRRFYDNLPKYYKGNHLTDKGTLRRAYNYISQAFERELLYVIDVSNTSTKKWKKVNDRANELKEQWK